MRMRRRGGKKKSQVHIHFWTFASRLDRHRPGKCSIKFRLLIHREVSISQAFVSTRFARINMPTTIRFYIQSSFTRPTKRQQCLLETKTFSLSKQEIGKRKF